MELLLVSMLVAYYMTRNTVQDLAWKATGQDPPSFRREQERIARRDARRPITDKREARKFWANAWADAWEAAGEKRERIHNKRMGRRHQAWDQEDLAEAEDEAYDRNQREPMPEPETATEPARPDEHHPKSEPLIPCWVCEAHVPASELTPRTVNDRQRSMCPLCAALHDAHSQPTPAGADPEPTVDSDAAPKPVPAGAGDAQVIQFADWQRTAAGETTEEENSVSETTNLSAALAYTRNMANNARQGVSSVETSISGLTAGGVTGPTLSALAQAQEALNQAAAAFDTANAALVRHIQVQEAYAANRDAGSKQFVTAD